MNQNELLEILQKRFDAHKERHPDLTWADVREKLEVNPDKLRIVAEMERTGGEPDLVDLQEEKYIYVDCSKESPAGRRSLCYDRQAWEERKKFKPKSSALEIANTLGITLLNEAQYRRLQQVGEFDLKTSSWIATPPEIRTLGGALFADRRYDQVFVYHNSAPSYYASRGFRGYVKV